MRTHVHPSPASSPSQDGKAESPSPHLVGVGAVLRECALLPLPLGRRTPRRRLTTPISIAIAGTSKDGGALRQQPLRGGGREPFLGTRARSSTLLPGLRDPAIARAQIQFPCLAPYFFRVLAASVLFGSGRGADLTTARRLMKNQCVFFLFIIIIFETLPSPTLLGKFSLL